MKKYMPINCSYYDYLLELSTLKKEVLIQFKTIDDTKDEIISIIKDVYTKKGAEYLLTSEDLEIRLDKLITVNHQDVITTSCKI